MRSDTAVARSSREFLERFLEVVSRLGRNAEEIRVVAVSKTRSFDEVLAAVQGGIRIVGENRVQEAQQKFGGRARNFELHMIGHLQRNKVRPAVVLFDMIQSVDSVTLAEQLSLEAGRQGKKMPILLEVNSSGETQKFGFPPEDVKEAAVRISELSGLELRGLMTVGPLTTDETRIADSFRLTRKLYEDLKQFLKNTATIDTLSMGMTDDYELAIAEGSTMIRIGRAIFGERL